MRDIPKDIEWVKLRKACSLRTMFEQLRLAVKGDVRERNSWRKPYIESPPLYAYEFEIAEDFDNIIVLLRTPAILKRAAFRLVENHIHVSREEGKQLQSVMAAEVSLRLNDIGECVFLLDGKELYSWQLRKLALEELLFCIDD